MTDDKEMIERHAEYKNMNPREYCIYKINEWQDNLRMVSDDYAELSREEFLKRIEEEQ